MTATRALTWLSRAFYALAGLLVLLAVVYVATHSQPTTTTSSREYARTMSAGDMHVTMIFFSTIVWSGLVGSALRTLVTAQSWPRALVNIAGLVGFGLAFAAPMFAVGSESGLGTALAFFAAGFLLIVVSSIVGSKVIGAEEAAASVDNDIARVKDVYRQAQDRNAMRAPPASFAPQTFIPPAQTFMPAERTFVPEPPSQEPPGPSLPAR
jgi:hypothetical protein